MEVTVLYSGQSILHCFLKPIAFGYFLHNPLSNLSILIIIKIQI